VLEGLSLRFASLIGLFSYTPDTWELFLSRDYTQDALMAKHRMVVFKGHKLIYVPTRQSARFECYDLEADPDDLENIYSPEHPVCAELKELLLEHMVKGGDGRRIGDYVVP
jgi:hypothetical protein